MSRERRFSVIVRAGARTRGLSVDKEGTLRITTTAAPEKGKANKDVVEILAEHFDVPRSCVEIVSGHANRRKIIKITA